MLPVALVSVKKKIRKLKWYLVLPLQFLLQNNTVRNGDVFQTVEFGLDTQLPKG